MKRVLLGLLFSLWTSIASAGVTCTLPFNLQNGTTADATQVMANYNALVTCLGNAAGAGVNTDITALNALSTPITPLQGGTNVFYGAGGGTANAQTVATVSPATFTLTAGYTIFWLPSAGNTSTMTLAVSGTAATTVKAQTAAGVAPLVGGEVISGQLAKATYDGTQWVLDLDVMSGFGSVKNLASATTTDLGTALSHSVNITGTTAITSFGSTASLQRPLYKLVFSGALTLTYNATSMILPGAANITTSAGDSAWALYLNSGNWQITDYTHASGISSNPLPTISAVTTSSHSGGFPANTSGTYTPPASARYIRVRLIGGGGGGGGGNTSSAGTAGNNTTFSTLTGSGGSAGPGGGTCTIGGTGGAASGGNVLNLAGGSGTVGGQAGGTESGGGAGGGGYFGGAGSGGIGSSGGGGSGATNTGSGGGGGSAGSTAQPGCGGGAGGYVEHIITSPAAVSYSVGATASGSTSGGSAAGNGGTGAAGQIIVEEYY